MNDTKKAGNLHALQLVLPFLFHFTIAGANGAYGRGGGVASGDSREGFLASFQLFGFFTRLGMGDEGAQGGSKGVMVVFDGVTSYHTIP